METITEFPVEQPTSVFDGPLGLVLLIAAVGLVCAVVGFFLGQIRAKQAQDQARRRAAEVIYDAIDDKLRLAVSATGGSVETRANELLQEIDRRLGNVSLMTKGFGTPAKAIDEAIRPKPKAAEAKKPEVQEVNVYVPLQAPMELVGETSNVVRAASNSGTVFATNSTIGNTGVTNVTLLTPPNANSGYGGTHKPSIPARHQDVTGAIAVPVPPKPAEKPVEVSKEVRLTPGEHQSAIRMSLDLLAQHWSARDARIAEIQAAQVQLVSPAPLPYPKLRVG